MAAEDAGRSELTEFVADHIFRDIDGDKLITVVNGDGLADEIRGDHRSPGPSLDSSLLIRLLSLNNSFFQFIENVRTFL